MDWMGNTEPSLTDQRSLNRPKYAVSKAVGQRKVRVRVFRMQNLQSQDQGQVRARRESKGRDRSSASA